MKPLSERMLRKRVVAHGYKEAYVLSREKVAKQVAKLEDGFNEIMKQTSEQQSEDFKRIDKAAAIMEKLINKTESIDDGEMVDLEDFLAEMKAWLERDP